jgi:hypothetical protein
MPNIPFSVYDFFGYLASGFIFLSSVIYVGTEKNIFCYDLNFVSSVFVILIVYIIGHLISVPAKSFYERLIVKKGLKLPSYILIPNNPAPKVLSKLFYEYFEEFPDKIANKIKEKAIKEDKVWKDNDRRAFFHNAYGKVKIDNNAIARLDIFLSLYGFCRNTSFTLLISFFLIFIGGWHRGFLLNFALCIFSLLACLGLFYKYLKFFRHYSYELFLFYLELPKPKEK